MKFPSKLASTLALLGLGGCASLSSYQEARVLQKGEARIGIGGSYYNDDLKRTVFNDTGTGTTYPVINVSGRLGVWNNLEIGVLYAIPGAIDADLKYQLLGRDSASDWQLSTGLKGGYANLEVDDSSGNSKVEVPVVDLTVPVYLGWTPTPWMGLTVTPQFTYRISDNETFYPHGPIAGANVDMRLGKEFSLVGEFGYHRHLTKDYSLINYGAVFQFPVHLESVFKMVGL
jgi:hypothetical protein